MEKLIKRYPNRKLYDTDNSIYVTLTDIYKEMVNGTKIRVVSTNTGLDITNMTLLNAIAANITNDETLTEKIYELVTKGGLNG